MTRNTIYLHGAMKKRFGPSFELVCSTPAEAIRALLLMVPGMREAIEAGSWRIVRGPLKGGRSLTKDELGVNLPGEMHLVAASAGAKRGGAATKIIIGVALIALVFLTAGAAGAGAGVFGVAVGGEFAAGVAGGAIAGLGLGITGTQVALFGLAMVVGGISQLLAPTPKANNDASANTKPSYLFNGALNQGDEGTSVPIGFGAMRIPGIVISQGIDVVDIPI